MALSVPLSRPTLRVGGGSAFYVRHIMRAPNTIVALSLILLFAGCSGTKESVSFYLSDQKPPEARGVIPAGSASLVVS